MRLTLIGPFFTCFSHGMDQREFMHALAAALERDGHEVWSAAVHGEPIEPHAPLAVQKQVFERDLRMIEKCEAVVAVLDDFDAGTVFEMGYAYALKKPIITCFWVMPERLNLMIAQSATTFCEGIEQTVEAVRSLEEGTLTREGWQREVF